MFYLTQNNEKFSPSQCYYALMFTGHKYIIVYGYFYDVENNFRYNIVHNGVITDGLLLCSVESLYHTTENNVYLSKYLNDVTYTCKILNSRSN